MPLATSVTFNGLHGVLILLAVILFLVAAVMAWVGHPRWASVVSGGLCLFALAFLVSG